MLILGFTLAACGQKNHIPDDARAILTHADQFELLSLNPQPRPDLGERGFHGYEVLGSTVIKDAGIQGRLVSAFEKGVSENQGVAAACFNPRHGIRAASAGRTADFLICFECAHVTVYGIPAGEQEFLISQSPQTLFNQILREANVPLADR